MGAARGVVVVQQAASLNPVTASAGRPPLALAVPPGPTQLCHTTQDQALELSKVALAALTKLHLMRAQNSNHCSPPEASSPQHLAVPIGQWSSAPCSLGSSAGICYPPALCVWLVDRCSRYRPCHIAVFPLPMCLRAQVLGFQSLKLVPRYCDLILIMSCL